MPHGPLPSNLNPTNNTIFLGTKFWERCKLYEYMTRENAWPLVWRDSLRRWRQQLTLITLQFSVRGLNVFISPVLLIVTCPLRKPRTLCFWSYYLQFCFHKKLFIWILGLIHFFFHGWWSKMLSVIIMASGKKNWGYFQSSITYQHSDGIIYSLWSPSNGHQSPWKSVNSRLFFHLY